MKRIVSLFLPLSVLAASPASAQSGLADLSDDQFASGIRYFMPQMLDVVQKKCASSLSADGYLANNRTALAAKFSAEQGDWADARVLLLALAGAGDAKAASLDAMNELPDDALKPLIDALVPLELGKRIKTRDCGAIESIMETLEPLPAENFARLVGMIFKLGAEGRGKATGAASRE